MPSFKRKKPCFCAYKGCNGQARTPDCIKNHAKHDLTVYSHSIAFNILTRHNLMYKSSLQHTMSLRTIYFTCTFFPILYTFFFFCQLIPKNSCLPKMGLFVENVHVFSSFFGMKHIIMHIIDILGHNYSNVQK